MSEERKPTIEEIEAHIIRRIEDFVSDNQATGRQNAVVRETDYVPLAAPLRSYSRKRAQLTGIGYGNVLVKGHKGRAGDIKKWAVLTCNTECPPEVSSLQMRTAVFARQPSSRECFIAKAYLAYQQGCETCPTTTIPFTTVGCAFQVLGGVLDGNGHLSFMC